MSRLLVSIIIPTFNRAHLIERAVDSAMSQVIPGDEIIIIDDDSTDNTKEVLSRYGGKIEYHKIPNAGAGAARNFGIRKSNNQLVAFLDSDDEWMPGKLELQRTLMEAEPEVLLCFSDFAVTFRDGSASRKYLINWHKDHRSWDDILGSGKSYSSIGSLPDGVEDFHVYMGNLYSSMVNNPYVPTSTLVVRRRDAGSALAFAEDLRWGEDWICYAQLARKGTAAYLECETAWQHGHAGERLTDSTVLDAITTRIDIMERVWGADENYLKSNRVNYDRLLREQRLLRAGELIALGRSKEARDELKLVTSAPLKYRALASMPEFVLRAILEVRRRLKSGK